MFLLLCEYATAHGDGTISVVRGGIDNIHAANLPTEVRIMLTVIIGANEGLAAGEHDVHLTVLDEREVHLADAVGRIRVVNPDQKTVLIFPVQFVAMEYGRLTLRLECATVHGEVRMSVKPAQGRPEERG